LLTITQIKKETRGDGGLAERQPGEKAKPRTNENPKDGPFNHRI